MSETTTYQPGDTVTLSETATITLGARKGFSSRTVRWNWSIPTANLYSELTFATAEDAIAHARRTMNTGECAHRETGWCPDCHDASNR